MSYECDRSIEPLHTKTDRRYIACDRSKLADQLIYFADAVGVLDTTLMTLEHAVSDLISVGLNFLNLV